MASLVPEELYYSESHEWIRVEEDIVTIGITDYAQHELDSIQFVEFPLVGSDIAAGSVLGTIEAVKAAEDLISPVTGKVIETNNALEEDGKPIHEDAYGKGWLVKLKCDKEKLTEELAKLLNAKAYKELIESE